MRVVGMRRRRGNVRVEVGRKKLAGEAAASFLWHERRLKIAAGAAAAKASGSSSERKAAAQKQRRRRALVHDEMDAVVLLDAFGEEARGTLGQLYAAQDLEVRLTHEDLVRRVLDD